MLDSFAGEDYLVRVNKLNYIESAHSARLDDGRVKTAHAPMRGGGVQILHAAIEDALLYSLPISGKRGAWFSRSRKFQSRGAGPKSLAGSPTLPIETARGEVLAQGSVEHRPAFIRKLVNHLSGKQQECLLRAAVELLMKLIVAVDAEVMNQRFSDGALGYASTRNIDLNDAAWHEKGSRFPSPLTLASRALDVMLAG